MAEPTTPCGCCAGIDSDHIGLAGKQQRKRIDVGRANGEPLIRERKLGMQKARLILDDFDPGAQQVFIKRQHAEVSDGVIVFPCKSSLTRTPRRTASTRALRKRAPGKKYAQAITTSLRAAPIALR